MTTDDAARIRSLHGRWRSMLSRCQNPGHMSYRDYGGRGITVCDRWRNARLFIEDIESALGPCPPGKTLDRINNDGNYEPGNIRWATVAEQQANRRPPERWNRQPLPLRQIDGAAIKAGRASRGMTQVALAAAVGVNKSVICRLEGGAQPQSFATARKIAAVFGLPLAAITYSTAAAS